MNTSDTLTYNSLLKDLGFRVQNESGGIDIKHTFTTQGLLAIRVCLKTDASVMRGLGLDCHSRIPVTYHMPNGHIMALSLDLAFRRHALPIAVPNDGPAKRNPNFEKLLTRNQYDLGLFLV